MSKSHYLQFRDGGLWTNQGGYGSSESSAMVALEGYSKSRNGRGKLWRVVVVEAGRETVLITKQS